MSNLTRFDHNIIDMIPEGWERCDATADCDDGRDHRTFTWTLGTSDAAPHGEFEIHERRAPKPVKPPEITDVIATLESEIVGWTVNNLDEVEVWGGYLRQLLDYVYDLQVETAARAFKVPEPTLSVADMLVQFRSQLIGLPDDALCTITPKTFRLVVELAMQGLMISLNTQRPEWTTTGRIDPRRAGF